MLPKNDFLEVAIDYARRGLSVIPIRKDKTPYVKWTPYQQRQATEDELRAWWGRWPTAMIGIVTGKVSNLFVVDCDSEDGYRKIQGFLPDSLSLPVALTPRGGWHLYFIFLPGFTIASGIMDGVDFRAEGGYVVAPPSVNGTGKAYKWAEGLSLDDVAPAPMPSALQSALINNRINNSTYRENVVTEEASDNNVNIDNNDNKFFHEGRRDSDIFHAANCLLKGGCEVGFAEQVLNILAKNSTPPFPAGEVKAKIESAIKRVESRERNLTADIREWVMTTNGIFSTTNVNICQHLTTREEKKVANVVLRRLCEGPNPLLERVGSRHGYYRRIEQDVEPVNFLDAPTSEFPVTLPLGVSDYCQLFAGNIVICAGSKSAGKTAYLLNIVKDNMQRHEIVYLNSEMGDTEFRKRLELFEMPLTAWKFRPFHRMANFADLITPDKKIFIVDFLEVTTDFWKVAQYIQEIHKKLKEGIAIIALQKSDGKEMGRGGDFSKEKARLYIALDYLPEKRANQVKIVDAKAWRTDINPRGMHRNYKLIRGAKFLPVDNWSDETIKQRSR